MDLRVRQGATLQIPIVADDVTATTAILDVFKDGVIYLTVSEPFVINDGKAETTLIEETVTLDIDDYEYTITVEYSDGFTEIYPDPDDCMDDDCSLPTFTVCEGVPTGVS